MRRAALAPLLFGALAAGFVHAGALTPEESRGRRIYFEGRSPSGVEIQALLTGPGVEVEASTMPCRGCHGDDGRGRPEGGVDPSNISWLELTKPYGVRRPDGREHPPYTEESLARAISDGIDPAGNALHALMPRYALSERDRTDLIAYLKRLGTELDPGLAESTITVGTVLPTNGRFAAVGRAVRSVLEAYFEEVNRQGGIYRRTLELRVMSTGASPEETARSLRGTLEARDLFALVVPFMAGAESELTEVVEDLGVPTVGPLTLHPILGASLRGHVFYLGLGVEGEARGLVAFAAERLEGDAVPYAIVDPPAETIPGLADAVRKAATARGWTEVEPPPSAVLSEGVRRLKEAGTAVLIVLRPGPPVLRLVEEASSAGWEPLVLLPGGVADQTIPELARLCGERLYLGFASSPADRTLEALAEYRALARRAALPASHRTSQLQALASAKTLVEGLKRAGRDLTRTGLLASLEGLREFRTGLTPPLTYGPNRRIGAAGAHVVRLDPSTGSPTTDERWIEVRP